MFASFVQFIEQSLGEKRARDGADPQQALRLAVSALCVEMARADMQEKSEELERAKKMLALRFFLSDEEAQALINAGRMNRTRACRSIVSPICSMNIWTNRKNAPYWRCCGEWLMQDGYLDKYEDALMHKLAELLYVPLEELMLAKQKALAAK